MTGRRGHVQAAFTIKELRELSKIDGCELVIHEHELTAGLTDASTLELADNRPKQRIVELIKKLAMETQTRTTLPPPSPTPSTSLPKPTRKVTIRFLLQPLAIVSDENAAAAAASHDDHGEKHKKVHHMVFVKNNLIGEAYHQRSIPVTQSKDDVHRQEGGVSKGVEGVADKEIITCELVLKSVGYQSTPIEVTPLVT